LNALEAALRRIAADLARRGQRWALVGGFAVSARAEPRFTRDIDVAVAVDGDDAAEQIVRDLATDGYRILAAVEQDAVGRLATVRLASPAPVDGGIVVDVLFASSGLEREIAVMAEPIEVVPGLTLPVARPGHLIVLKLLARSSAALVMQRGFDRGRALVASLEGLLRAGRPGGYTG